MNDGTSSVPTAAGSWDEEARRLPVAVPPMVRLAVGAAPSPAG